MTHPLVRPCSVLLAVVALVGCDGPIRESRFAQEQALALVAGRYEAELALDFTTCSTAGAVLESTRASVLIEQRGNYITWTHSNADGSSGLTVRLEGALCRAETGRVELRLRGRSVVRRQLGDRFCRAEMSFPASGNDCFGDFDELCLDPNSIVMDLDACSGALLGRFQTCLRYGEACASEGACSMTIGLSARPVNPAGGEECPEERTSESVRCTTACGQCGCVN